MIVGVDFASFLAGLNQVLTMIPQRRAEGQVLPGMTVLSISMGWSAGSVSLSAVDLCKRLLQSIMNLGVIVVTSAGNDAAQTVSRTDYPAQLSTPQFPLITVGGVTLDWEPWETSQDADVYLVGKDVGCADSKDKNFQALRPSTGTSAGKQITTKDNAFPPLLDEPCMLMPFLFLMSSLRQLCRHNSLHASPFGQSVPSQPCSKRLAVLSKNRQKLLHRRL